MMKTICFWLMLCLALAGGGYTYGQVSINSGGKDTANQTGSISYSIGQTFSKVEESAKGTIHTGVQHPYRVEVTKTTPEWERAGIEVFFVYPNPTKGLLTLRFSDDGGRPQGSPVRGDYSCVLYDMNGRVVVEKVLDDVETQVDMSGVKAGTYVLRVMQKDKEICTMKVVKM